MASFDENGKYIKTNWKAGDKITATKLNKIEESIEAVNDNDISRHVEADARLDALEAKDVTHDKELTDIKNTIADNKAAAELGDYDINSRMTFLEEELNEGIEEVNNVASTVDEKIATAEANMTAQVDQAKADMEAMVAEVESEMNEIQNDVSEIQSNYLPLSGGTINGDIIVDNVRLNKSVLVNFTETQHKIGFFNESNKGTYMYGEPDGTIGVYDTINGGHGWQYKYDDGSPTVRTNCNFVPMVNGEKELGSSGNRWANLYLSGDVNIKDSNFELKIWDNRIACTNASLYLRGGTTERGIWINSYAPIIEPDVTNVWRLGSFDKRWASIYLTSDPIVSSDRSLKENIEYVNKSKTGLTYEDMYNFVKDDLGLATYNFIGDDKLRMNFIAQDLLANADGSDNKIGQMIVNPVAVPTEEEIEEGKPYPTLSYDSGMYVSVLAGALKEAINKIEQLEARIQELENK